MTRLLALETSTRRLSVALWLDGEILRRDADLPNTGSDVVLPWVGELLAEAGLALGQLDAIGFGAGPGSFTGVRLACAVAQGVGYGLGLPVIPVSTLAALALASGEARVWAVLDARMHEVYAAVYDVKGENVVERQAPICGVPAVLPAPTLEDGVGVGDGFAAYGEVLRARWPRMEQVRADVFPTASAVAVLARQELDCGVAGLATAQPIYVRDKVALTTVERLARGGQR